MQATSGVQTTDFYLALQHENALAGMQVASRRFFDWTFGVRYFQSATKNKPKYLAVAMGCSPHAIPVYAG